MLFAIYFIVVMSLMVLAFIFVWGIAGLIYGFLHFLYFTPPAPPPPPGPCANCAVLQAQWNSMDSLGHVLCLPNFLVASAICAASRCGWLSLPL